MKFYHYTLKTNLDSILENGIKPGSEIGKGEKIGAVLFDSLQYKPIVGNNAYLEVEINSCDPKLHRLNDSWYEYRGTVNPEAITAIANPPSTNDEVIDLYRAGFDLDVAFSYK